MHLTGEHDLPESLGTHTGEAPDGPDLDASLGPFAQARALLPDERDRMLLWLMMDGDRDAETVLVLYGLEGLDAAAASRTAHRQKDRVKARLRRGVAR